MRKPNAAVCSSSVRVVFQASSATTTTTTTTTTPTPTTTTTTTTSTTITTVATVDTPEQMSYVPMSHVKTFKRQRSLM